MQIRVPDAYENIAPIAAAQKIAELKLNPDHTSHEVFAHLRSNLALTVVRESSVHRCTLSDDQCDPREDLTQIVPDQRLD